MRQNDKPPEFFTINETQLPINGLCQLILGAGSEVMKIYESADFGAETKADNSPVTRADQCSHQFLVTALRNLNPTIPIVSEESTSSWQYRQPSSPYWLLDPLDGTKEFIAKNGEFTINVALIKGEKPVLGLVLVPVSGELFLGGFSIGAWKNENGVWGKISTTEVSRVVRIMASKSHLNAETQAIINQYAVSTLLQAGSSLKFCRIAEGLADLYPRLAPTCEWDTAAAQAVLEGAGGGVHQLDGSPMVYSKAELLNPSFIAIGNSSVIEFPVGNMSH